MASKKKITKAKPRKKAPSRKAAVLAKYEPVIRSQIEKNEKITQATGGVLTPAPSMKFGLAFAETGHLMYRWNGGPFQWVPYRALRVVVRLWNQFVCAVSGHDTFGPISDEDGTRISDKTCMHCSRVWKNEGYGTSNHKAKSRKV